MGQTPLQFIILLYLQFDRVRFEFECATFPVPLRNKFYDNYKEQTLTIVVIYSYSIKTP